MGWKIGDKPTVDPQDADYVLTEQGGNTRNTTWTKIKTFLLGSAVLTTSDKTIKGAINELLTSIGVSTALTTAVKTNLVVAINEVVSNLANLCNSNLLINGDFQVCQRSAKDGTKVFKYGGADGTNIYTVDRWQAIQSANGITCTIDSRIQATKKILAIENYNSTGQIFAIQQILETGTLNYGKNTLSFGYLASIMNLTVSIKEKSSGNTIATLMLALNSDFTQKQISFDIADITKQYIVIFFTDAQTYSATSFYLANVKLEKGSIATPFASRPIADELLTCKRYYQGIRFLGVAKSANLLPIYLNFPTSMRIAPSATLYNTSISTGGVINKIDVFGVGQIDISVGSGFTWQGITTDGVNYIINNSSNQFTATNSYDGYMILDAEIY